MSELLAEPAGSEVPPAPVDEQPAVLAPGADAADAALETDPEVDLVADATATLAADPAAGSAPVAPEVDPVDDVVVPDADAVSDVEPDGPDLAEQPTAASEDLPVVPDLVQSVVEPEPADRAEVSGGAGLRGEDTPEVRPDLVEFGHEPEVEARPRRRRRATSRPAGPAE